VAVTWSRRSRLPLRSSYWSSTCTTSKPDDDVVFGPERLDCRPVEPPYVDHQRNVPVVDEVAAIPDDGVSITTTCMASPCSVRVGVGTSRSDRSGRIGSVDLMTEDLVAGQVVEAFVQAWLRSDLEGVMACVTDDVVFSPSGSGEVSTYHGRDAVRTIFVTSVGDDEEITLGDLVATGDVVLQPWWYPAAADGTTLRGLDLYTLRDGKIAAKDVFSKRSRSAST